jgi:hypothetical protein
MRAEILLVGVFTLLLWGFVWYQACKGPLRWAMPTSLFAMGNILFYIFPSLYWQFRPWSFRYPSYFDGLPLVLTGFLLLAVPFFLSAVAKMGRKRVNRTKIQLTELRSDALPWIFVLIVFIGVGWRIYLLSLGFQARLSRENPTIMGSESLALMVGNFSYYYPICYFALSVFGNKLWRRIGILFWVMDGLLQLYTLHRYAILIFVLRSVILLGLIGLKIRLRYWAVVSIFMIAVVSFVGWSHQFTYNLNTQDKPYLSMTQVVELIKITGIDYFTEARQTEAATNVVVEALDVTMERAYEARSASAVMMGVPDVIPYFNGKTFTQVFYSFIPRYFWEEKPDLGDIQAVTTLVMPDDLGINPAGSLAELYMNFGFVAVFIGGVLCFFICKWTDYIITRKNIGLPIICVYPIIAELFLAANMSLTRRLSEGVRGLIVVWLITMLYKRYQQMKRKKMIQPFHVGEPGSTTKI